jgi:hypothetical protein
VLPRGASAGTMISVSLARGPGPAQACGRGGCPANDTDKFPSHYPGNPMITVQPDSVSPTVLSNGH